MGDMYEGVAAGHPGMRPDSRCAWCGRRGSERWFLHRAGSKGLPASLDSRTASQGHRLGGGCRLLGRLLALR